MSDTRETVMFLNPSTCGVYKDGGTRFKTNHETGRRTQEIDNELIAQVDAHLAGGVPPGASEVALEEVFRRRVLVPTYSLLSHKLYSDMGLDDSLRYDGVSQDVHVEQGDPDPWRIVAL